MARIPVTSKCKRFGEVLVLAALVCIVTFLVSYFYGSCAPRPPSDPTEPYIDDLVSFYCPDSQYNEMASMFMVSSEVGTSRFVVQRCNAAKLPASIRTFRLHCALAERNQTALPFEAIFWIGTSCRFLRRVHCILLSRLRYVAAGLLGGELSLHFFGVRFFLQV
jgi:hypothetical protein